MNSLHSRDVEPGHFGWIWTETLVTVIIATCILLMRLWSRILNQSQRFGADDWMAVAAWPFVVAQGLLIMFGMHVGIGVHTSDLTFAEVGESNKFLLSVIVVYYFNISFIRISLSLYYMRLFGASASYNRRFRLCIWANIALNLAWQISITLAAVYQCSSPSAFWDATALAQAHCNEPLTHQYFCSVSSVVLDLIALLLPVPMIFKLQLKPSKKVELVTIFFVGYGVPILTTGRLIDTLLTGQNLNKDPYWNWPNIVFWIPLESTVAYLGICMPAVLFLARRWRSSGFSALFNRRAIPRSKVLEKSDSGRSASDSAEASIPKNWETTAHHPNSEGSSEALYLDVEGKPIAGIIQTRTYTVTSDSINEQSVDE